MTYIATLASLQMAENEGDWRITQRFTKGLPTGPDTSDTGTRLALLVCDNRAYASHNSRREFSEPGRFITWIGSVQRFNTVGPVDSSITIEPMRRCPEPVALDGPGGVLAFLSSTHRAHVERALTGSAGHVGSRTWQALQEALLRSHPELARYTEWLLANPNVNFWGTLSMARAFAPVLAANDGGSIVNIASSASWFVFPGSSGSWKEYRPSTLM